MAKKSPNEESKDILLGRDRGDEPLVKDASVGRPDFTQLGPVAAWLSIRSALSARNNELAKQIRSKRIEYDVFKRGSYEFRNLPLVSGCLDPMLSFYDNIIKNQEQMILSVIEVLATLKEHFTGFGYSEDSVPERSLEEEGEEEYGNE